MKSFRLFGRGDGLLAARCRAGGSDGRLNAFVRAALMRGLDRLVAWPRLPFVVRNRLRWRQQQQRWIARRPASSFNEKVRWKMLKDRRPILTTFTDKVAV